MKSKKNVPRSLSRSSPLLLRSRDLDRTREDELEELDELDELDEELVLARLDGRSPPSSPSSPLIADRPRLALL